MANKKVAVKAVRRNNKQSGMKGNGFAMNASTGISTPIDYGGLVFNVPPGSHILTLQGGDALVEDSNGQLTLLPPALAPTPIMPVTPVASMQVSSPPQPDSNDPANASQPVVLNPITNPASVQTLLPNSTVDITQPYSSTSPAPQLVGSTGAGGAPSATGTIVSSPAPADNTILYIVLGLIALYVLFYFFIKGKK